MSRPVRVFCSLIKLHSAHSFLSQLRSVQRSTVMFNSHAPPGGGASSAQGNYAMSLSVPSYSASSAEFMNFLHFSRNITACMKCALVVVEESKQFEPSIIKESCPCLPSAIS